MDEPTIDAAYSRYEATMIPHFGPFAIRHGEDHPSNRPPTNYS
jgi:hypothetical protein